MRTYFVILLALASGPLLAESDHAAPTLAPPASDNVSPSAVTRVLSPRERLVQDLWAMRLGTAAIDELVRLFKKPEALSTTERFATELDRLPKNTLTPEQREKLLQWYVNGLRQNAPVAKRLEDLGFAAQKVQSEVRAQLAGGNGNAPLQAGAGLPPAALAQIEQTVKAQFGELQNKMDQVLDQKKGTPKAGRESSELLDKLLADLEKPKRPGAEATPAPAPTPPEFHRPPPGHDDEAKDRFPERDGLRPPPRGGEREDRGGNGGARGNQNGANGGGGGEGKEKKDDANKQPPQSPGGGTGGKGKGRGESDDFSSLKKSPTPAPTPKPLPTPGSEMAEEPAEQAPAAPPAKMSDLPLSNAPVTRNAYNPPSFGGGFGGGGGGGGGGGAAPMGGGSSFGAMPSLGPEEEYAVTSGAVRPVIVGYASSGGGGDTGEEAPSLGNVDEAPVRESAPSAAKLRPQILEIKPVGDERHWIFDSAGVFVKQLVCDGIDADKVAVCETLKERARTRALKLNKS